MLPEPKISYKPFWGICRPLNSWRANSPNPIQIYCANKKWYDFALEKLSEFDVEIIDDVPSIDYKKIKAEKIKVWQK